MVMFVRVAADLAFPVEVLGCPTIREDEASLSRAATRNSPRSNGGSPRCFTARFAPAVTQRKRAPLLPRRSRRCSSTPSATSAPIQYFAVVDGPTMRPLDVLAGSVRLLASIKLGSVRLLDNIGVELAEG